MSRISDTIREDFEISGKMGLNPRRFGSSMAWLMWAVSMVFALFQFFLQLSSGEMVDGLMKSFSLTALGGSLLASAYYYIYVSLQVPAGMLIDRFGPRRLLGSSSIICVLGCLIFAGSHLFIVALIGRLLMGMGAAFAFVGSLNLIARWFPAKVFGFMAALSESIGMLGSLLGGFVLADVIEHFGWRNAMWGASVLGVLIIALLWAVIRDQPSSEPVETGFDKKAEIWQGFKILLKNPIAWYNGIYSGAMFGIVTVFVALWGIPFIEKVHHISLTMATFICNIMFVGVAIGCPIVGWLDARIHCRRQLLSASAFAAAVILSMLILIPGLSLFVVALLMLLLGLVSGSYVITFVIADEIATPKTRGTSVGFVNMLSVMSAPLLQPLIGFMLYLLSGGLALHQVDAYSIRHFQMALMIMPCIALLAGCIAYRLPEAGRE